MGQSPAIDYDALAVKARGATASQDYDALAQRARGATEAPPPVAPGYFEDRGMAGAVWHPPGGGNPERTRPDNSVLGVPPELAVVSGLGIGRAIAAGTDTASRVYGGAKAAFGQAAPALKYEVIKTGLESVGVPASIAIPLALTASGYRRRAAPRAPRASGPTATPTAAPTTTTATAAPAAPAATPPAAPAPPAAAAARTAAPSPSAGPGWSPQRLQNELGLAARRRGVTLTEPQYAQAAELVKQGRAPLDAVRAVGASAPPVAPLVQAPVATPTGPKPRMSAAETMEYVRLRNLGKSHPEAVQALEQQRAFVAQFGTPAPETVRTTVADRNATGRWPQGGK